MPTNRRFLLMRRPVGAPVSEDFALVEEALPDLADGQFLIRNRYASLDPAMRGWMDDAPSYMPPIPLGSAVRASTVGEVTASKCSAFPVGTWVAGLNAIEHYSVGVAGGFTQAIDISIVPSPTNFLSVLGAVGMTGRASGPNRVRAACCTMYSNPMVATIVASGAWLNRRRISRSAARASSITFERAARCATVMRSSARNNLALGHEFT